MAAFARHAPVAASLTSRVSSLACCPCRLQQTSRLHCHPGRQRKAEVELTSKRYPGLKRGPYSALTDSDVAKLEGLVSGRVITDQADLQGYNTDWLRTVRGSSQIVVRPKTTEEVSAIISYCSDRCLAVVPQGGNTSLVGGSVPVFDEVIVSTQLLNNIISLDEVSGTLVCEAGCILSTLEHFVAERRLTMPLDLGAKGSCHIGGNLATNAGGIRLLRYGSLHGSVLGLEAVLPSGEVLDCMSTLRKDNTGYDLKQLLIGSEGTLGVITKAAILCPQRPSSVSVALLGCSSFESVLDIFRETKKQLAEILSAFEFMDSDSMDVVVENLCLSNPISDTPFYVLIETGGSNKGHDQEKLSALLESLLDCGRAVDGTLATDLSKISAIWALRERLAEGLLHDGYCYKYDLSLPQACFYQLVLDTRHRVADAAKRVVGYGHVGDGNLHLNITTSEYDPHVMELIEPFLYDWVAGQKGSISAEHGLGLKKRDYIYHSKSQSAVRLMQQIKKIVDPKGIMNPYKVLPSS